ncbi:hypothetical protein TNCV_112841 [Trichonephila clavipes]|nr:hypothetical protein TNCV_112841 [Trichonephila clavipes]
MSAHNFEPLSSEDISPSHTTIAGKRMLLSFDPLYPMTFQRQQDSNPRYTSNEFVTIITQIHEGFRRRPFEPVTRTTSELASNYRTTSTGGRLSSRQILHAPRPYTASL